MPAPQLTIIDKIYFKLASVFIDDIGRIKAIAQKINDSAIVNLAIVKKVIIRGHACDTPIVSKTAQTQWGTNDKLAFSRAEAVYKLLVAAGVKPEALSVESRGDAAPCCKDRDINRRVEIFIVE